MRLAILCHAHHDGMMKCLPKYCFWLMLCLGLVLMALGALSFCASSRIMNRARIVRDLAVIKDLQDAITFFESEYGRYPSAGADSTTNDLTVDSANTRLVASLLGDDLQDNPRGIKFIDPPIAKNDCGGLVGERGSFRLRDMNGHPYQVVLDASRDKKVRNPDHANIDAKIQSESREWLPTSVAIYSCGFDGKPQTADDITSWRAPPPAPREFKIGPRVNVLVSALLTLIGAAGILTSRKPRAEHSAAE